MANYNGVARTNYVAVEDLAALKKALLPFEIEIIEKGGLVALMDNHSDGGGWPHFAFNEEGDDLEFDMATIVMPHVKEGEVLVLMEAGHEKYRYVNGYAAAWVRLGEKVKEVAVSLDDIYDLAAKQFGIDYGKITRVSY